MRHWVTGIVALAGGILVATPAWTLDFGYIFKSGYYQLKLQNRARPIDAVLKNPDLDPDVRHKLELVREAKAFASTVMGLSITKHYEHYVAWDSPYVVWAVTAAPEFEMRTYRWSFPIVGEFPYLGFFEKDDALAEEARRRAEGYDTYVRGVSAYSTLGWFRDPVMSTMLRGRDGDLVNLILHESTHSTVYFKNNADRSERLAVFVGNLGEIEFLKRKHGPDSPEVKAARDANDDDRALGEFMKVAIADLTRLYAETTALSLEARRARKTTFFDDFHNRRLPAFLSACKGRQLEGLRRLRFNNAVLLSFSGYFSDLSEFDALYEAAGRDLPAFLSKLK